LKKKKRFS